MFADLNFGIEVAGEKKGTKLGFEETWQLGTKLVSPDTPLL